MTKGIIMQSGSIGATPEAIEKVLVANGYEAEKPAAAEPEAPVEPKRDDYKSDEDFETAQTEYETSLEEAEQREESEDDEKEKERLAALPKKSRKQRAIEKATRELKESNRQLSERLAAVEGKGKRAAETEQPKLVAPKREDFKTDEEFDEAKFQYRYTVQRLREELSAQERSINDRLKENFESYQAQVADFKEEHEDWDDVIKQNKTPIHNGVFLAIQEQENGAQVAYYLGKHPDYARRLAEMTELSAIMEVGRLSERLKTGAPNRGEADGTAKRKPKPTLPEPVKPLSTSANASTLSSREAAKSGNFKAFKQAQRRGA